MISRRLRDTVVVVVDVVRRARNIRWVARPRDRRRGERTRSPASTVIEEVHVAVAVEDHVNEDVNLNAKVIDSRSNANRYGRSAFTRSRIVGTDAYPELGSPGVSSNEIVSIRQINNGCEPSQQGSSKPSRTLTSKSASVSPPSETSVRVRPGSSGSTNG